MLEREGNLFEQEVDAVCITTNGSLKCDGRAVMGKGIALQAVQRHPEIAVRLGQHLKTQGNCVTILDVSEYPKYLVSFPVKQDWYNRADLNIIRDSCIQLVALADLMNWKTIVLPRPGCGAGKLLWDDVRPLLNKYLDDRFTVVTLPEEAKL